MFRQTPRCHAHVVSQKYKECKRQHIHLICLMHIVLNQTAALVLTKILFCVFVIANCFWLLNICEFDPVHSVHCATKLGVMLLTLVSISNSLRMAPR